MSGKTLKERTATGLMWGAVNNLLTQLLSAMIGIVLARLLSPADYGLVGMLAIFSAIANSLQESGFTAALTNLKQVTHREYNAVFWFSTSMAVVLYTLLYFMAPLIARFFHQPELTSLSRLYFLAFVFSGLGVAHAAHLFRNMMNREKTIIGLIALIGSSALGLILAWQGYAYWSLAWMQVAYIVIGDCGRLYYVRWLPSLDIDLKPLRQMFGFSSKILATNIVNQVTNNILSFIFGRLFTAQQVGNYTQANKWNNMGNSFVSGTIQQIAQPVLSSIADERDRQVRVFRKILRFTVFLSFPAMFGLAAVSQEFIFVTLGPKWADSAALLQILCIGGAFIPVCALYQNLAVSRGRSDIYMWCTLSLIATQIALILYCQQYGMKTMVAVYTLLNMVWVGVWQLMCHRLIGIRHRDFLKDIVPFMVIAVAVIALVYYLTMGIQQPVVLLCLRIPLCALLYFIVLRMAHTKILEDCLEYVRKIKIKN